MSNRERVWKRSNEADTEEALVSTSFFGFAVPVSVIVKSITRIIHFEAHSEKYLYLTRGQ